MGQGSDSCGGYEVDCDDYEDGLAAGLWTQRNGVQISIENMTLKHLYGARQVAKRASARASFTSDAETFDAWVEAFDAEIARRNAAPVLSTREQLKGAAPGYYVVTGEAAAAVTATVMRGLPVLPPRGEKVTMICHCGQEYKARKADIKRKWGLSCSKRCAAIRREFGKPPAKRK